MTDTRGSNSSWVLPVEAKNLIKFLSSSEPVPMEGYPDEDNASCSTTSGDRKDYSGSYDFENEDSCLNDSTASDLSSNSALLLHRAKHSSRNHAYDKPHTCDSEDFSCSADSVDVDQSFMVDALPPLIHQPKVDSPADKQTKNLLDKVKRLNHGLEDTAFTNNILPRTENDSASAQDTDHLDAVQSMYGRQPTPSRFEIADYRNEIVRLRGLLSDEKDKFRNLHISTGVYEDLKRTPEFELSLLDFVRLQCADVYLPLQEEVQQLRQLSEEQQRRLDEGEHTLTAQAAGMEVQKRLTDSSVEAFKMEARAASERCDRLGAKLQAAEKAREESEGLAARCMAAEGERDGLREEVKQLRDRWDQQGRVLMGLNESEAALRSELSDLTKTKDMLELDKSYLSRELSSMVMKYESESRLVDAQKAQTSTAELKVQELTDRLLQLQLTHRSEFDTRLESEVRRLREGSEREMGQLKETSRDIIDRENKVLREAKAALEGQLQAARMELTALGAKFDKAREELFVIQSAKDSDIAALRAEGKLTSYNLTATSAHYEERCEQLRQVSLQLEHSREEAVSLRAAVQQFEAKHSQDLLSVTAERDALRHKLSVYTAMESNVDAAVALVAENSTSGGAASKDGELHPALTEFARYPSDPNRRLAQCVAAVSRALEAQKESEVHHQEAQQWKTKCTEVSRQLDVANRALSAVPHPQGYLINKNRELEDMISKQQQSLTEQETTLTDLTTQLSQSVEAKAHLSHRLEQLLRQRAEVEGLRVLLERMQQYEEEEVNASSSEEDEESDDLEEPAPVCVKQSGSARRKSRDLDASRSSVRSPGRDKLSKTWDSPAPATPHSSHSMKYSPAHTPSSRHSTVPKGMSPALFAQMTSPHPEGPQSPCQSRPDTLTSTLGSGFAVTPNSKSPSWHTRDTVH